MRARRCGGVARSLVSPPTWLQHPPRQGRGGNGQHVTNCTNIFVKYGMVQLDYIIPERAVGV